MILDLRPIINAPGERLEFEFDLDLADVDFGGLYPIQNPVVVTGEVRNTAGMLTLAFQESTILKSVCDRCLKPFDEAKTVRREYLLSADPGSGESDNILPLEGSALDIGELARTDFILGMDTKTLCSKDCKGICPGCGVDLNQGECVCKKQTDPRLAVLAKLLENSGE